jgi:hypothetical protein
MSQFFVRDEVSGVIDLDKSIEAFQEQVEAAIKEEKLVKKSVMSVFQENPGIAINMAQLITLAQGKLGSKVSDMTRHAELISDFVKANTGDVAAYDAGEATFANGKGRAGGTRLWSDASPEFLAEARARLAAKKVG